MPEPTENSTSGIVEFTADEKQQLAKAITKAACGIAECWDVLSQIGARIGKDWEPQGTSVADIAEWDASVIYNPASLESLDADQVAECFNDAENWHQPVREGSGIKHECDNCGSRFRAEELKEIKDYAQRVDSENIPSGECPKCGALCYEIETAATDVQR